MDFALQVSPDPADQTETAPSRAGTVPHDLNHGRSIGDLWDRPRSRAAEQTITSVGCCTLPQQGSEEMGLLTIIRKNRQKEKEMRILFL